MPDSFCPSCGTEVDEDARFCPTCGRTLLIDEGESAPPVAEEEAAAIPPAPAWPPATDADAAADEIPAPEPVPPAPAAEPAAPPPPAVPPAAAPVATAPAGDSDLPFTVPTTLSGWLIGGGSLLAALALLVRLGALLNLLMFVALLGITASVFLADRIPKVPRLRLGVLAVLLVCLGVSLERAAFRVEGVDTVFLIAMIAAAGGALLIELDRDRPVPPPGGTR
jgi:zinc-ribbon domain